MPRMTQRRNANVASLDSDITSSLNKSNSRQSSKLSKDEKISNYSPNAHIVEVNSVDNNEVQQIKELGISNASSRETNRLNTPNRTSM